VNGAWRRRGESADIKRCFGHFMGGLRSMDSVDNI
jgi:hypothetical protein